jgi:hypothetical protein
MAAREPEAPASFLFLSRFFPSSFLLLFFFVCLRVRLGLL